MKKEQLLQVEKQLKEISKGYEKIINKIVEHKNQANKNYHKTYEKIFDADRKKEYLKRDELYTEVNNYATIEKYYDLTLKRVFNAYSIDVIKLFFNSCNSKRDITDFEKLMTEYNKELKKYPYCIILYFTNDYIKTSLVNFNIYDIDYKYYLPNEIAHDYFNSSKTKWDTQIFYENFSKHAEKDYFKNYSIDIKNICFDTEKIIKEIKELKELKQKQNIELKEISKKHQDQIEKKDKYKINEIL